ncbi:type IV pilus assembly protein PilQ [Luteibacter jiangsuensis]|uniref:Type IV pilus assembly protein PilQ n=1 Tax=Luteibacter jiangsuensis TaxID=637577 RepID=A0ABT9T0X6_9GAMM|nr:type IV pilus secretin family protein [Luteibacter jiangsuensis]MDQ0010923.1 type IV pilus assembly protein PilQ [Luteibacter jiangsuensis]
MTTKLNLPGSARHRPRRWILGAVLALSGAFAGTASAANALQNVTYDAQPGGRIELTLAFADAAPEPKVFTTSNPPRIAIDLPDTTNAYSTRHLDIGKGATSGVSVVSAGGRTRVTIELFRDSAYKTRVQGKNLIVTVNNGPSSATTTTATVSDPTKALPSSVGVPVSNIDFRRGQNGEGRVLVTLGSSASTPEMHREGDHVIVSLPGSTLPPKLAQRLDVLDFATPVQSIEPTSRPGGARLDIRTRGEIEISAYQNGTEYAVEVAPKKAAAPTGKNAKGQEPTYSGSRLTFNFQDIPVRSALQLIADEAKLNLVASDSVGGSVTLRLVNTPWDQALDVILRAKGLDKRRSGNVVWIAPQAELANYEQSLADARQKAQESAELISDYIPISYGKAEDIAKLLTSGSMQGGGGSTGGNTTRGFLSPRGSVSFDDRTNTLLINDTPDKIRDLRELIGTLDRPVQQVLIESRIVVATDQFTRQLGVRWGAQAFNHNNANQIVGTTPNLSGGTDGTGTAGLVTSVRNSDVNYANAVNQYNANGGTGDLPTRDAYELPGGYNVNLPVSNPAGSIGLAILGANYLVDLELSAAQTEGRSEVISSPRVITANQQEAVIKQGTQIGYVTYQASSTGGGASNATVQFKDAVLELRVTPTITADSRVYLKINVKKDALAGNTPSPGGGFVPSIDTREINTSVLVDNGQTVVLGGIYEITKSNTTDKVPGLGDIPGIGVLFRRTNRGNNKAELLIFVTPRILSDTLQ